MKAIVIFGSTTGNTEEVANYVGNGLREAGHEVLVKNVTEATPQEMTGYDIVVLGSSTWNEGLLQDDFVPFYEQMTGISLAGKKAAAFGCGESIYEHYCAAVDTLANKLKELGAEVVGTPFKVDGDIGPHLQEAQAWGKSLVTA